MIDTIKFKTHANKDQIKSILDKSIETVRIDREKNILLTNWSNKQIRTPSYNSNINVSVSEEREEVYIEFSVPKQYYGHNVYLLYYKEYLFTVEKVFKYLKEYFGSFPELDDWRIIRMDICYSWKLYDNDHAQDMIDWLKTFEMSRKSNHGWKTACARSARTYSLKFYKKYEEYYKHDFVKFKKLGELDLAYKVLDLARGVMRYEITMRSQAIKYHCQEDVLDYRYPTDDRVSNLLNWFLMKFLKMKSTKQVKREEALNKLKKVYINSKAVRLYTFWITLSISESKQDRNFLLKELSPSQISRNMTDLAIAGIGIDSKIMKNQFDINIPSEYVTNHPPAR